MISFLEGKIIENSEKQQYDPCWPYMLLQDRSDELLILGMRKVSVVAFGAAGIIAFDFNA